ncbi:hypothetical protein [Stutzerimonas kunmingensis]|uniref:hypothetical protein n=1 Tax=Stutzerimonas kunmingensis TaxID=1211807 RepID=UPI0035D13140
MAEAVDDLLVKLGLELDAKGFREANTQFSNIRTTALATGAAIGTAFIGMAKMSNDVAKSADELAKWSRTAGVSAQYAHKLGFAMRNVGGSDADAKALIELANSLRDSAQWGELPARAFTAAGFNPQQIQQQGLDAEQTVDFLSRGLAAMSLDQRRQIGGALGVSDKAFRLLSDRAGMQNSFSRAGQLGGTPDDVLLANAEAYVTATTELGELIDGFKNTVAKEMLPGMTSLVEGITGWSIENRSEIEEAFKEAMPYLKATATGIGVLVAAQVGTKGIAMLAAAATTSGPAAAVLGLGAFYMDEDNRRDGFDSFTGGVDYYKRWLLRQMGVKQEDDPIPEGWIHVPEFNENTPARPSSPRAIPRSTDRTPNGLTPDELSYRPSPGELIAPGTHAEFTEGNRRLMRGAFPGAYAPPPNMTNSNSQSSVTIAPVYNIDASGSTDPAMTEQRVRHVIDKRIGELVMYSMDDIPTNVQ